MQHTVKTLPLWKKIIYAFGRLWDAITDPIIATMSDRSKSRFGRRRKFLAIGGLPFALLSILAFTPPVNAMSPWNAVWLFVVVTLFYLFMTMYVTPFFAWLSELVHNPHERLFLKYAHFNYMGYRICNRLTGCGAAINV